MYSYPVPPVHLRSADVPPARMEGIRALIRFLRGRFVVVEA